MSSVTGKKGRISGSQLALNGFFILVSLMFVLPMLLIVSVSFTSEFALNHLSGYSLIPEEFSLDAYKMLFRNPQNIINGYKVTVSYSVISTFIATLVGALAAYPLSRSNFRLKTFNTWFIFFTMLFGPSMIPTYIVFSKYYHLVNNYWVYILPSFAAYAWNIMIFRTFFKGLPESLFESAKLDGAQELTIFFRIVVPLSTPVIATLSFGLLIGRWNDYATSMIYIRDNELWTLQYQLQRIMEEAKTIRELMNDPQMANVHMLSTSINTPTETLKYAMCIIAAGPMMFVFPFFQRYLNQGLVVGSVKG